MVNGTEEETLLLMKGKDIEIERAGAFKKREVGLSVFIDTEIGVTLQWDRGTHITVKLSEEHAGKVEGLCGNYDQDSRNDLCTSGKSAVNCLLDVILLTILPVFIFICAYLLTVIIFWLQ